MKSSLARERDEPANGVFVGILGQNFFSGAKLKFAAADLHGLIDLADEVKFDAAFGWIVSRVVLPVRQIEMSAELAVDVGEKIFVELRGHAGAVVVGGLNNMSIFLEIDADEQAAAVAREIDQAGEKFAGVVGFEISDGRPWKINHAS